MHKILQSERKVLPQQETTRKITSSLELTTSCAILYDQIVLSTNCTKKVKIKLEIIRNVNKLEINLNDLSDN